MITVSDGILAIERVNYRMVVASHRFSVTVRGISLSLNLKDFSFRFERNGISTIAYGSFEDVETLRFVADHSLTFRFEKLGDNGEVATYGIIITSALDDLVKALIKYSVTETKENVTVDD